MEKSFMWIKVAFEVQSVLFEGTREEKTEKRMVQTTQIHSVGFQKIQMQMRIKIPPPTHFFSSVIIPSSQYNVKVFGHKGGLKSSDDGKNQSLYFLEYYIKLL